MQSCGWVIRGCALSLYLWMTRNIKQIKKKKVPIAKFEPPEHQGLLSNRLLHHCLDIVLSNLKACANSARVMLDPGGGIQTVRTFLAAYIANLPEQQPEALSCVAPYYALSSMAGPSTLGDTMAQPLWHGQDTLRIIQEIMKLLEEPSDQRNLAKLQRLAKEKGLNGVDQPFWRDWLHADPSSCLFLAPDALHQWHKLFQDHPIEWAKAWLGTKELDRRVSVLQPRVGFQHFWNGFTRFKQHTGKEMKDLERVFLGIIAGHKNVSDGILKAMRAVLDFIYLAQYNSHSTATLTYLQNALDTFHKYKQDIADSGVRSGQWQNGEFHIPKIELMQHVGRLVTLLGSAPQFSSEQTEWCHIDMVKEPYKATNRKAHTEQMCHFLDQRERMRLFSVLTSWHVLDDSTMLRSISAAHQEKVFQSLAGIYLPASVRDIFRRKTALCSYMTAFQLRQKPDLMEASVEELQELYQISCLKDDLGEYFVGSSWLHGRNISLRLPFSAASAWDRVRAQLRDPQDRNLVLPALTICVSPTRADKKEVEGTIPFCFMQTIMSVQTMQPKEVKESKSDYIHYLFELTCSPGWSVAQVRLIFVPHFNDNTRSWTPYAYVQPFRPSPQSKGHADPNVNMFSVVRIFQSNNTRKGLVVPLDAVPSGDQLSLFRNLGRSAIQPGLVKQR